MFDEIFSAFLDDGVKNVEITLQGVLFIEIDYIGAPVFQQLEVDLHLLD